MSSPFAKPVLTIGAAILLVAFAFSASGCASSDQLSQAETKTAQAAKQAEDAAAAADRAMKEASAARADIADLREQLKALAAKLDQSYRKSLRK